MLCWASWAVLRNVFRLGFAYKVSCIKFLCSYLYYLSLVHFCSFFIRFHGVLFQWPFKGYWSSCKEQHFPISLQAHLICYWTEKKLNRNLLKVVLAQSRYLYNFWKVNLSAPLKSIWTAIFHLKNKRVRWEGAKSCQTSSKTKTIGEIEEIVLLERIVYTSSGLQPKFFFWLWNFILKIVRWSVVVVVVFFFLLVFEWSGSKYFTSGFYLKSLCCVLDVKEAVLCWIIVRNICFVLFM